MHARRLFASSLPALLLLGCSESDDTVGPGPDPQTAPTIESFTLSDPDGVVLHGDFVTLRWRASGATSASLSPPAGNISSPTNGSVSIRPFQATTYTLTVANAYGTDTAQLSIAIQYRAGVYVNPAAGDDANDGQSPAQAVATLDEALSRSLAGGTIFLAAGAYTTPITIDGAQVSVYGGLDPATFFEGQPRSAFVSTVRPTTGIPLSIHNSLGTMEIANIVFDARDTEALGAEIVDAQARLLFCTFDTRASLTSPVVEPAALRVRSEAATASVEARSCRFLGIGAGSVAALDARGVSLEQGASGGPVSALLANCFIRGGRAASLSSGVRIDTDGEVGIGMCSIGAEITATGGLGNTSAAIRILRGHPSIGGNILFTRGSGARYGVIEGGADTNPSSLEGNLFVSVGTVPYDNFDDLDAASESELNQPQYTIGGDVVGENLLETGLSISNMLVNVDQGDFHLVHPIGPPFFIPNPAADRGDTWVARSEYGAVGDDIDGDPRPSSAVQYDLGADED